MGTATDPLRGGSCILQYCCGWVLDSIDSLGDANGESRSGDVYGKESRCVAGW